MSTFDQRGEQLRTFDQLTNELSGRPASRQANLALLWELAAALSDSLHAWSSIVSRLELENAPDFDCERAGTLIIESALDEILDAPACSILASAFALHFPA